MLEMLLLGENGHHQQSILNHGSLLGVFFLKVNRLITTEAHFQKVHSADCCSHQSKGEPCASISIVFLPTVQHN